MLNNICSSKDWQESHELSRTTILSVLFNLKSCATVPEIHFKDKFYLQNLFETLYLPNFQIFPYNKEYNSFYFSKSPVQLELLRKECFSLRQRDYNLFGTFFDYPKCCIQEFIKRINQPDDKKANFLNYYIEVEKAINQGSYNPYMDYIFHIPCSPFCKDSEKIGESIYELLLQFDKNAISYFPNDRNNKIRKSHFF